MLLAIDAGNTNVKFAIFDDTRMLFQWRVRTEPGRTADEYSALLRTLFVQEGVTFENITGVVIASVVPQVTPDLQRFSEKSFGRTALLISHSINLGLEVRYQPPGDVGTDRLVDAAAAVHKYGAPCIVIDFGTATTFNAVAAPETPDGLPIYLGGAICLGVGVSLDALFARAAKIPKIELEMPSHAIGSNTAHALQSGIVFGYIAQVAGMVSRFRAEMDAEDCPVIATGGHITELIAAENASITAVEPLLTLEGLRLIYERNVVL